jgi:hypothetical protein
MCAKEGAYVIRTHLTVGVSLSKVLTASKGNENVLLTRVSDDPGMDAS